MHPKSCYVIHQREKKELIRCKETDVSPHILFCSLQNDQPCRGSLLWDWGYGVFFVVGTIFPVQFLKSLHTMTWKICLTGEWNSETRGSEFLNSWMTDSELGSGNSYWYSQKNSTVWICDSTDRVHFLPQSKKCETIDTPADFLKVLGASVSLKGRIKYLHDRASNSNLRHYKWLCLALQSISHRCQKRF